MSARSILAKDYEESVNGLLKVVDFLPTFLCPPTGKLTVMITAEQVSLKRASVAAD